MRVEQHAHAALAQPLEQPADRVPAGGVERAGRLVEQQQPRRADERLREPEPLLHPLRHRPDVAAGDVAELDELEQLAPLRRAARRPDQLLVQPEQLVRGAPVGEAEQLGQVAELRVGGGRAGRAPADLDRSRARPDQPAGDLHQRRLAGAVGPEQPEQLAGAELEVDSAQRLHRAIGLAQARDREGGGHPRVGSHAMTARLAPPPLRWDGTRLHVLDQTLLPAREEVLVLEGAEDTARAIERLSVRGAPLIGVAAAFGLAMEVSREPSLGALERGAERLATCRPTARNLAWAVERVRAAALAAGPVRMAGAARAAAEEIQRADEAASAALSEHCAALLNAALPRVAPVTVLTHCNSGCLAASGRGTGLGVIAALADRRPVRVLA